jgi:hypothetical protein
VVLMNAVVTGAIEALSWVGRLSFRRHVYELARARSEATGKPLVVVGAPTSGPTSGTVCQYKCGDLPCVDLAGCEWCGARPTDVTVAGSIDVPDGGAVVCVQYVLEYVDDVDAAWTEVRRAAGSTSDVFVAHVKDWETMTRLATGAKWIVDDAPPNRTGELKYHAVRAGRRVSRRGTPRRVL